MKVKNHEIKVKLAALGIAAMIVAAIVLLGTYDEENNGLLRIASANDLAGLVINMAAGQTPETQGLRLADCCGAGAELALEAGVFDIAVLCPDAAELFLANHRPFVVWGGIVSGTNVLVSESSEAPATVGYTFGRSSQRRVAAANLGYEVDFIPMITLALPNAMAVGAVDAIVMDIFSAVEISVDFNIKPLPHPDPTAVLVVHQDFVGKAAFADFIYNYNQLINGSELSRWTNEGASFLKLPWVGSTSSYY
ncbi:MAG: ABC transporter substrate-binding protein [Defluviitaleaceae bacterium]|nr:ABC transporter substrate-binding protein [Defluviitaleaceae bacterium]